MASNLIPAVSPAGRRVRAYFAPVDRAVSQASIFDAAGMAAFDPDSPPAPWLDLGWCGGFTRRSDTKIVPLMTGAPGLAATQVRTLVDVLVSLEFESWGKLQMALSAGVQQMNVLRAQPAASANGSGGAALAAVPLSVGTTATTASTLDVGAAAAAAFNVGDLVAVDVDYTGQIGFVGSGVSGGFVKSASTFAPGVDYIRRVTLNVARLTAVAGGVLSLASPLLAGAPTPQMKVSQVIGFCDREGGGFFQEWSALFVFEGEQGDRILFHYPRLQAASGAAEAREGLVGRQAGTLARLRLPGSFRALPVQDATDGETVVCFRSYLPASMRAV